MINSMQYVFHTSENLEFIVLHTSECPRSTSADWFLVKSNVAYRFMSLGNLMEFDSPCMINLVVES